MELQEAIKSRRTIRSFSREQVSMEEIRSLIESATFAPSACNKQAWKFIIIDDKTIKRKILRDGAAKKFCMGQRGVLVLYRNNVSSSFRVYKDHYLTAGAAIQNFLLSAHERGLGCCWITDMCSPARIRRILKINRKYDVISYIAIGKHDSNFNDFDRQHFSTSDAIHSRPRRYELDDVINLNRFEDHIGREDDLRFKFIQGFFVYKYLRRMIVALRARFLS